MPGTPHNGCQAVIKLIITVIENFLIGIVLIPLMFDFIQGPQGPQGVQGERGPIGEGLPGPKVGCGVVGSYHSGSLVFSREAFHARFTLWAALLPPKRPKTTMQKHTVALSHNYWLVSHQRDVAETV